MYALKLRDRLGVHSKEKIKQVEKALRANNLPVLLPEDINIDKTIAKNLHIF
jgi:3-dehydroquinate synthetase